MQHKTSFDRIWITAAAIVGMGLTAFPVNAATKAAITGEFDQVQTIVTPRLSIKSVDHVTFKGNRYTMQSVDSQNFVPYTDVADGQNYFHFVPSSSEALKLAIQGKPQAALDELKQQSSVKIQGMTKQGSLTVNGYPCDTYGHDLGDGAKVTMYLSTDPHFPYIVKTVLSVPAKNLVQTNEISNVKLGGVVDDSIFVLPKGTKIVDQPATPDTGQNAAPTAQPTPTTSTAGQ